MAETSAYEGFYMSPEDLQEVYLISAINKATEDTDGGAQSQEEEDSFLGDVFNSITRPRKSL